MDIAVAPALEVAPPVPHVGTMNQIRGSSLLLAGRFLSMAVNFGTQVLIVNYLTKTDYGAFAYALSIVALGETVTTFGLDRAITRFVPIYDEQREYGKLFGTIIMVFGTILSLGIALILLVWGLRGLIAQALMNDSLAFTLLLLLIALSPTQALDGLLTGLFAVFANPRSIFFRRYILAPGLRLIVVGLLILGHSNVYFLAAGYLAAGLLGVGIYSVILFRVIRKQELFQHFNLRTIQLPARDVFSFTIPLLTSDLVYGVMNTSDAILLEHFGGAVNVASFRAVQTPAGLNQIVISSFALLFTPLAARMFAHRDREGINNLYWQTAIWMAIVSFPIFAMTFSLAQPVTLTLYGKRYADSAIILALLSFGYYFNTALGHNGLTLKVFGKLRYVVVINVLATIINLGLNLFMIPRFGALGAAVGTCGTLIVHNLLKQSGLRLGTGINLFEWSYLRVYLIIGWGAIGLLLVQRALGSHTYLGFAFAVIVSMVVFGLNRKSLNASQMFPELLRLPMMRRLLA